jgi:hypothetical protein
MPQRPGWKPKPPPKPRLKLLWPRKPLKPLKLLPLLKPLKLLPLLKLLKLLPLKKALNRPQKYNFFRLTDHRRSSFSLCVFSLSRE